MKSVTIRDPRTDHIIVKVLHRKNGEFEVTRLEALKDLIIDIRDDQGCKVRMGGAKEEKIQL